MPRKYKKMRRQRMAGETQSKKQKAKNTIRRGVAPGTRHTAIRHVKNARWPTIKQKQKPKEGLLAPGCQLLGDCLETLINKE